jgi:hypothetical protein
VIAFLLCVIAIAGFILPANAAIVRQSPAKRRTTHIDVAVIIDVATNVHAARPAAARLEVSGKQVDLFSILTYLPQEESPTGGIK